MSIRILVFILIVISPACNLLGKQLDSSITDTLRMNPIQVVQSNHAAILGLRSRELSPIPSAQLGVQVADQLGDIPGVSVSSMGPGMTRPVLRGYSGSRVAVLVDGLRMDNQQWQDEHGLTIGPFSNDKLSVYLGPSAILAGGDAMGGLVQIETVMPQKLGVQQQSYLRCFSNNLGVQAGYEREIVKSNRSNWFGIVLNQFGDYHDANGTDVLNTRNDGFQVKWGCFRTNNKSQKWINYRSSFTRTGISRALDSLEKLELLNGEPRDFEAPHHAVLMHALSIKSRTACSKGYYELQYGIQSNTRLEVEEGEVDGLAMQLSTAQQRFFRFMELGSKWRFSIVELMSLQNNNNMGQILVIPNYLSLDGGLHGVLQRSFGNMEGSFNLGGITKTYQTKNQDISGSIRPIWGLSTLFHHNKFNSTRFAISKGSRNPNFHELFANGMSEDAFRFDHGNSGLKPENIVNFEMGNEWNFKRVEGYLNLFYSKCSGYIALLPTGQFQFGAPEFRYVAHDAISKGMEGSINFYNVSRSIQIQFNASYVSIVSNGTNLAFVPPMKLGNKIRIQIPNQNRGTQIYIFGGTTYSRVLFPDEYSRKNDSYMLAAVGINCEFRKCILQLNSTNVLNRYYIDPMSLLKLVPYAAPGRSINASVKCVF